MAISFVFNPFTSNFDAIDQVTLAAVGSSPNANAASITSPAQVLTLQPADATNPGVVTATTQSFGGNKSFLGTVSLSSPTINSGALNIKSISDTLNEGVNLEGSGAGANRIWYLSPQANGDLYLYNPNQNYTALVAVHNGFLGTGPRMPSLAWQVTNADNNTNILTPGSATVMGICNSGTTNGNFGSYLFLNSNTELTSYMAGVCSDHTVGAATGYTSFVTAASGVLSEVFRMTSSGNKSFLTLDMNSTKITSVQDPSSAQDAATKNYVDTTAAIALAAFGSSPNNDGASLSSGTLTLQPADATHPGGVSTTTQSFAGNKTFTGTIAASNFSGTSSGTNTGDVSLSAFGSTPNANGASLTGQALTLQPADATNPGGVSTTTQSFAGNKTFTGTVAASNLSGTNTGDITLAAVGAVPSANGASLSGQTLTLQPFDGTHPGVVTASGGGTTNFLRADGAWVAASGGTTFTSVYDATNYGLSATVSANALTVALKQPDGSTNPASGSGAVTISFRSATATSGAFNSRTVTGALSVVIPSGTTIGTQSGFASYIYIYAIDNSGTVELALSLSPIPDWSVVTTTAISGGTSPTTMYSTTARTGVPCRYIGRLLASEATAGTWATSPSELTATTSFPECTPWQQFTSVITGSVSNPTKGGTTIDLAYFRKVGDSMQINWTYVQTSGGANGSGAYRLGLPPGYVADTTKLNVSGNSNGQVIGTSQNTGVYQGWIYMQDSTHIEMVFIDAIGSPKTWGSGQSGQLGGTNVNHSFCITGIPIVGW